MSDRQEILLQARVDAAYAAYAVATRQARDAVKARNLAKRKYERALGDRERQPKTTQ